MLVVVGIALGSFGFGLTDVFLCRRWLFAPSWTERTGRHKLLQSVFVTHDSQSSKSKAPEINDFYRRMNNAAFSQ